MISTSKFLKVKFEELTSFHKQKIIERAHTWRASHVQKVLELMRSSGFMGPIPPLGSNIFDPAKWDGANWIWYGAERWKTTYLI